jgi:non-ribosomal peptide synthetase component E (peptide arylation enzyme)
MSTTILSLLSADALAHHAKSGAWRDDTIYAVVARHAERFPSGYAVRDRSRRYEDSESPGAQAAMQALLRIKKIDEAALQDAYDSAIASAR